MLKIKLEPADFRGEPAERCCLCRTQTRYWYTPFDVALCPPCAKTAKRSDLPTKAQWCAKERTLRRA